MPIDFAPPQVGNLQGFNVTPPPNPDPLATLAQMSQLRTQGLQQQQAQLGIQQAQMQLASQRGLMQAFVEGGGDFDKTIAAMRNHPDILPSDYLGMQQHAIQIATQRMALTKDEKAIQDHDNERWSSLLGGGINSQDDLNKAFSNGIGEGLKVPPELLTPQGQPMPYTGDPTHYQAIANSLQLPAQISAQKLQAMQAKEAGGKAEQAAAETGISQFKLGMLNNLIKGVGFDAAADIQVPPSVSPNANRMLKNQLRVTTDPDKIAEAFQHYSDPQVQLELEQKKIPLVAEQARTMAAATAPIEIQKDIAKTIGTDKAVAALGPQVFAPIADPVARGRVATDVTAYTNEYIKQAQAGQSMLNTINEAQHGNQQANAQIPTARLKELLNRVTNVELEQNTGFGTLKRKLENMLSTNTQGKWSADTLNEWRKLAQMGMELEKGTYDAHRATTKRVDGIDVPEADISALTRPSARNQAQVAPPDRAEVAPYKKGGRYGNMTYLGGDPKDQASWRK